MSGRFTPSRYDERVLRLAVGVEPQDVARGGRVAGPLRVLIEDAPKPLHRWRLWRPGETLDAFLGRLDRHRSGRFALLAGPGSGDLVLRLTEPGGRRALVPRRVAVTGADPRILPIGLFPGTAASLPSRATVVRGRVVTPDGVPVRWARIRAADDTGEDAGWAHGDDRGEFVLVVDLAENALAPADDPLAVSITVTAVVPAPEPDPDDPLRPVVDPLWDLPVEPLPDDDALAGRVELPGQTSFGPFPFDLPLGRETSLSIPLPIP
ncbi:hypothetical protein [Actinoplanes subglobosus]|uniref:Carboxypeptidase regulatory-like domain-containing protein n=1 Tax=Actinoplanes subglobosus TaxID=1547892 RepID=A0ABV8IW03_9ACTN